MKEKCDTEEGEAKNLKTYADKKGGQGKRSGLLFDLRCWSPFSSLPRHSPLRLVGILPYQQKAQTAGWLAGNQFLLVFGGGVSRESKHRKTVTHFIVLN